jgi:hypothetical protein
MKLLFQIISELFPWVFGLWVINFFNKPENADFIIQLRGYLL